MWQIHPIVSITRHKNHTWPVKTKKTIQSSHVMLLEPPAVRQSNRDMWLGFVILDGLAEIPHVVLFELKISDPKSTIVYLCFNHITENCIPTFYTYRISCNNHYNCNIVKQFYISQITQLQTFYVSWCEQVLKITNVIKSIGMALFLLKILKFNLRLYAQGDLDK